ncbi:MAG: biopolymer transporter ExbD, partial [Pseudomonadota bacterium]|nr:biopolymer transporter ExbD [Pseudomonadota bacterium]
APLLTVGVPVDLPESAAPELPGEDEPLAVSVNVDGVIFLQDTEITIEELGPRLRAITENNADARVFVRGDKTIDYGQIMAVMGAISEAGFNHIALITEFLDRKAN